MLRHAGLRAARPLLADAAPAASAAASSSAATAASSARPERFERGERGERGPRSRPLGERYDAAGYPKRALNVKYSSLVAGQHFATAIHDRRTQLMALLSACNLIREVIAQEGRILIHCKDPRLQGDLLAAARDCGEFTHYGKWPPGGFTNRPQVMAVPQLPALVIALEHDNHVLMREAFQMCIPRVGPVDVYNNKADFTPEVPISATQMTLAEKRKMLTFFSGFIAKLKFGSMPNGDTQGRFKEYVNAALASYTKNARDLPEPYIKSATRLYDERPDLKFGIERAHATHNEKRAFEESVPYRFGALQPNTYRDAAQTADDMLAENPPALDEFDLADHIEYTDMSAAATRMPAPTHGSYVHEIMPDGQLRRVDEVEGVDANGVAGSGFSHNARDFETEEAEALARAAKEAGVKHSHLVTPRQTAEQALTEARGLAKRLGESNDAQVREEYEQYLTKLQDAENEFTPYLRETEVPLKSSWAVPGEDAVQQRLWRLKQRVRKMHDKGEEQARLEATEKLRAQGVTDPEELQKAVADATRAPAPKRQLQRPKRAESHLENTLLDPQIGRPVSIGDFTPATQREVVASRKTGRDAAEFKEELGEIWSHDDFNTVEGWDNRPVVPLKKGQELRAQQEQMFEAAREAMQGLEESVRTGAPSVNPSGYGKRAPLPNVAEEAKKIAEGSTRGPAAVPPVKGAKNGNGVGGARRNYSTSTRPLIASRVSDSYTVELPPTASSWVSMLVTKWVSSPFKWVPAMVTSLAFAAFVANTWEEPSAEVVAANRVASQAGVVAAMPVVRDLVHELDGKRYSLKLAEQSRAAVLQRLPIEERAAHAAVLADLDLHHDELKAEVQKMELELAELKAKLLAELQKL